MFYAIALVVWEWTDGVLVRDQFATDRSTGGAFWLEPLYGHRNDMSSSLDPYRSVLERRDTTSASRAA